MKAIFLLTKKRERNLHIPEEFFFFSVSVTSAQNKISRRDAYGNDRHKESEIKVDDSALFPSIAHTHQNDRFRSISSLAHTFRHTACTAVS